MCGKAGQCANAFYSLLLAVYNNNQLFGIYNWNGDTVLASFDASGNYQFNRNVFATDGTQRNYGIEFQASGHVTQALAVLGGVTWIDPELGTTSSAATSNKRVVGVPSVQANILLDYSIPAPDRSAWHGLAFNASIHYTGKRAANVFNTTYADSYVTLNVGTRYAFHVRRTPLVARLEIDNVANERYWLSVYPSSLAGATNASNSAFAGLPRTVQGTIEADF